MTKKAFSLVEVVVAALIIIVLAAITVPALSRMKLKAQENTAISMLRIINTAQAEFRARLLADEDNDDLGEFGSLGHLTGTADLPVILKKLSPPLLPHGMAPLSGKLYGILEGYCFLIYLPSDNDYRENKFRAYAWPLGPKVKNQRVFVINQYPDVYWANNTKANGDAYYKGDTAPAFNAATSNSDLATTLQQPLKNGTGTDGQVWSVLTK